MNQKIIQFDLMCQLVEDCLLADIDQLQFQESNVGMNGKDILNGLLIHIQKANTQGYNIKILQSVKHQREGRIGVVINLRLSQCFYDLVIEIWIDIRNKKLQCRASFLQEERYVLTESSQKRRMICRKLIKFNNEIQQLGLKLIQNMETGKLMILTINDESSMFISKDILWCKIKSLIKLISEVYLKYSSQLYQLMNKQRYKQYLLRNNGSQQLKRIKKQQLSYTKLCRQLEVSHVNFGFSCRADEASFPTLEKSQSHLSQLKQFILNTTHDLFQRQTRKIFCTNFQEYLEVPYHMINYEIQHNQSKLYSSYLKTPVPRDPNPGENKFIFNNIQILKPQSVRFQDTHLQGGTSKIIIAKLSFYYCESICSKKKSSQKKSVIKQQNHFKYPTFFQSNFLQQNEQKREPSPSGRQSVMMLTKMIGAKVPKKKGKQDWDEKNENQKNIIKLFKSGVSAYVLKYYISKQPEFNYKGCLLMDFLPNSQPLSNYLEIFNHTLSLNSKSFLLVNIANSLRFLNDYHVVHMDLGLNNILVYRDYLIKLIDFGQGYSKNINTSDGKYFKRGYTLPFCSPEYFQRKNNFTIKQDVFSFAVIAWRIIFNDYMFFPSDKVLKSYKNKSYLNKIFLAPERGEAYANQQTIYLLYRLLLKCLSPDELLRCEPSWLTIFFKIIYFYLL